MKKWLMQQILMEMASLASVSRIFWKGKFIYYTTVLAQFGKKAFVQNMSEAFYSVLKEKP